MGDVRDSECPACGQPGPHYVPASLGEPGFYTCDVDTLIRKPVKRSNLLRVAVTAQLLYSRMQARG
jgi:hypothetical protein